MRKEDAMDWTCISNGEEINAYGFSQDSDQLEEREGIKIILQFVSYLFI
jgi:hypothetical protein